MWWHGSQHNTTHRLACICSNLSQAQQATHEQTARQPLSLSRRRGDEVLGRGGQGDGECRPDVPERAGQGRRPPAAAAGPRVLLGAWDVFRTSVEKYPGNPMLGGRRVVDGKAGEYAWMSYREVYDVVMKLAASIGKSGVNTGFKDVGDLQLDQAQDCQDFLTYNQEAGNPEDYEYYENPEVRGPGDDEE